jgi:TPR repeat protein
LLLKDPILLRNVAYTVEELNDEGTAEALWFLGRAYGYGYHTIAGDAEKAFQSFGAAVALDPSHGFAWLYHARCLRAGFGVAENQEEAYESYKKAAALGVALAYNEVRLCWSNNDRRETLTSVHLCISDR